MMKAYKDEFVVIAFFSSLFIFILFGSYVSARLFWKSKIFQNALQDELAFLTNMDNLRINFSKIIPRGFFSFQMYDLKFFTLLEEEDILLNIRTLYFSPRLTLFPPAMEYNFRAKLDNEGSLQGKYKLPLFSDYNPIKKQRDMNRNPGNLTLTLDRFPIQFFLTLLRDKLSFKLTNRLKGDVTGIVIFNKNYPYDLSSTSIVANLQFNNIYLSVSPLDRIFLGNTKGFSINPFDNVWEYKNRTIQLKETIEISSKEKQGTVKISGGILFGEDDEPDLSFDLTGDSELFHSIRTFFQCPIKQNHLTLRGFKKIACS
jgi:hypothetical protein